MCLGGILILLFDIYQSKKSFVRPLIVIGPVLIGGGLVVLLCSLELCVRVYRARKRGGTDLERGDSHHEVKHWVEPGVIPFGWGQWEKEEAKPSPVGGGRILTGQHKNVVYPLEYPNKNSGGEMTSGDYEESLLSQSPHR